MTLAISCARLGARLGLGSIIAAGVSSTVPLSRSAQAMTDLLGGTLNALFGDVPP